MNKRKNKSKKRAAATSTEGETEDVQGTSMVVEKQDVTWKIPNYDLRKTYAVPFVLHGMKW